MVLHSISICSGVGGLDVAAKLGFEQLGLDLRTVCYIEREASAAATLVARMEDEALDQAPVWSDLNTFDPRPWAQKVDLVIGGIPCQPHSQAGKRLGSKDPRDLWGRTLYIATAVGARCLIVENVPGFRRGNKRQGVSSALERALSDLAQYGFDAEWCSLRADDVDAPHRRERVFLLAYSQRYRLQGVDGKGLEEGDPRGVERDAADTNRERLTGREKQDSEEEAGINSEHRGDPLRLDVFPRGREGPFYPTLEPTVRGTYDGVVSRVDRLRAAGNGVVSVQGAVAVAMLLLRAGIQGMERED